MVDIQFGELPPRSNAGPHHSSRWQEIAEALRSHPGQWALVDHSGNGSTANEIKSGRFKAFQPGGGFEAKLRNRHLVDGKARYDIWARYVGDQS